MLSPILGLCLSIFFASASSAVIPAASNISAALPIVNLPANAEWPPVPFAAPYFHNKYVLRFRSYGGLDNRVSRFQMAQGFDALIFDVVQSEKETYLPSEPPLATNRGVVRVFMVFKAKTSNLQVALALQALRDLVDLYGPREMALVEFGWRDPWRPMAAMELRFAANGRGQMAVDAS